MARPDLSSLSSLFSRDTLRFVLRRVRERWRLVDLESKNGTRVNGEDVLRIVPGSSLGVLRERGALLSLLRDGSTRARERARETMAQVRGAFIAPLPAIIPRKPLLPKPYGVVARWQLPRVVRWKPPLISCPWPTFSPIANAPRKLCIPWAWGPMQTASMSRAPMPCAAPKPTILTTGGMPWVIGWAVPTLPKATAPRQDAAE